MKYCDMPGGPEDPPPIDPPIDPPPGENDEKDNP